MQIPFLGWRRGAQRSNAPRRLLIIRLSSFGDIVQACVVPRAFLNTYPDCEIDWLVRDDFASLLKDHRELRQVIKFERQSGLRGLWRLGQELIRNDYDYVYDAHSNLRSFFLKCLFRLHSLFAWFDPSTNHSTRIKILTRSKERLRRVLFFKFRWPVLPQPYRGSDSYLWPLAQWGINPEQPEGVQFWSEAPLPETIRLKLAALPRPWIIAAPSAAWEMKRWPIEHWRELIRKVPASWVFLGGPQDRFIEDIVASESSGATLNLAGALSLSESTALLNEADLVIANDTGLLHAADLMLRPTIALIGPTAFGYPSRQNSKVLELNLPCKPCSKDGRGRCRNAVYKKCLVELSPDMVANAAREVLLQ